MANDQFESRIAGIPCIIAIIEVAGRYEPAQVYGPPERCYEAQYPEISWEVWDRKGYPAPWLEKKMSKKEREEMEGMVFNFVMTREGDDD